MDIASKLDRLAELHNSYDKLESEKREIIETVLPPEMVVKLDEIEAEYSEKEKGLLKNIEQVEVEIRTETKPLGRSFSSSGYIAMWSKGRVTWDNKGLALYSIRHPEILEYKKEGEPIVSIRKKPEKGNPNSRGAA